MLKTLLMLPLAYGLVFALYLINRPLATSVQEPPENIAHVLNQEMVRAADYHYLLRMQQQGLLPNRQALAEFQEYYELIVANVPGQADAYGMLGYCQYYQGNEDAALGSYQKALEINPMFEGYYYNLAVIYYNQGNYARAADLAQKAVTVPLDQSAESIFASKRIYMLILAQRPGELPGKMARYLEDEKQKAAQLLQRCLNGTPGKLPLSLI